MSYSFTNAGRFTGDLGTGISVSGGITLALWFKWSSHATYKYFFGLGASSGSNDTSLWFRTSDANQYQGYHLASPEGGPTITQSGLTAAWYPVVCRFGASAQHLAISGSYNQSGAESLTASTLRYLSLGRLLTDTDGPTALMAHVCLWDKYLTDGERDAFMAGDYPATIANANLKGYWPLLTESDTQTDASGNAGPSLSKSGTVAYEISDNPSVDSAAVRFLKLLAHSSAAGASNVAGTVFDAPSGGNIIGSKIGEFTGMSFLGSNSLDGGKAKLLVNVASFGGSALTTANTPHIYVRTSSFDTGIVPATVIEV